MGHKSLLLKSYEGHWQRPNKDEEQSLLQLEKKKILKRDQKNI